VAQPVDLLVDLGVLFDVGVGLGDVGLRLVVVIVGNEVVDGVIGEELAELPVQLGGQGFVVGDNQGGLLDVLDHVGDGERVVDEKPASTGKEVFVLLNAYVVHERPAIRHLDDFFNLAPANPKALS